MKKFNVFLLAIACSFASFAQTKPHLAVKAGVNFATLNVENVDDKKTRAGLHLGITGHMHITPQWAVQPELLYSQEGGRIDFMTASGNEVFGKFKNDYLNIPVMLQYMFDNGFRVEAGPQLGLLLKSEVEDQNGVEDDAASEFKSTNISFGFGLNYLTFSGLGIGGRYNLGLSDISEGSGKTKGNAFQISLFYMLDPSHKRKSR